MRKRWQLLPKEMATPCEGDGNSMRRRCNLLPKEMPSPSKGVRISFGRSWDLLAKSCDLHRWRCELLRKELGSHSEPVAARAGRHEASFSNGKESCRCGHDRQSPRRAREPRPLARLIRGGADHFHGWARIADGAQHELRRRVLSALMERRPPAGRSAAVPAARQRDAGGTAGETPALRCFPRVSTPWPSSFRRHAFHDSRLDKG